MKILLGGATGFIGRHLQARLEAAGHAVLPVSRRPGAYDWSDESLRRGVREADAVVNLAGENLFDKRWTAERKRELRSSRIETTRKLALLAAERRPACFLSTSAVGWYGANESAVLDESSPHGQGFLAELCRDWEEAVEAATEAGVRTAVLRLGVVLGRGGGALAKMLPFFRLGLGGPLGSGKQWVSWIHVDDVCSLFLFLLDGNRQRGPWNATAPAPVRMSELARTLGRVLHRPAVLPAPAPMMRLALGEVADVLLTGQNVVPRRALEAGFRFAHSELEDALRDVVSRRPVARV